MPGLDDLSWLDAAILWNEGLRLEMHYYTEDYSNDYKQHGTLYRRAL